MIMGNVVSVIVVAISLCVISGCTKKTPSQVIYRYDDNRYLELKGYYCEGALWYHDGKKIFIKRYMMEYLLPSGYSLGYISIHRINTSLFLNGNPVHIQYLKTMDKRGRSQRICPHLRGKRKILMGIW